MFPLFKGIATSAGAIWCWMHRQSTVGYWPENTLCSLTTLFTTDCHGWCSHLLLLQSQRCGLLEVWNPTESWYQWSQISLALPSYGTKWTNLIFISVLKIQKQIYIPRYSNLQFQKCQLGCLPFGHQNNMSLKNVKLWVSYFAWLAFEHTQHLSCYIHMYKHHSCFCWPHCFL